MARKKTPKMPVHGPARPAEFGLCSVHRTNLLEQGTECWDCGVGVPVRAYDPDATTPMTVAQVQVAFEATRVAQVTEVPATAKQVAYLMSLWGQKTPLARQLVPGAREAAQARAEAMTKREASATIDRILGKAA